VNHDDLPPLPHGKVWVNYTLHGPEGAFTADQMRAYVLADRAARAAIAASTPAQPPRDPLSFSDETIRKGVRAFQSGHNGFDDLSDWRAFLTVVLAAAQGEKP
jgi:hypothetical protein